MKLANLTDIALRLECACGNKKRDHTDTKNREINSLVRTLISRENVGFTVKILIAF